MKARALRREKHLQFVQRIDEDLRSSVTRTMLAAQRAPEVAASGPQPGMTPTEVRIARDAMEATKDCPAYLTIAQRIWEGSKRAEVLAERQPAPRLNVETIQVAVSNTYVYERIEDKRGK